MKYLSIITLFSMLMAISATSRGEIYGGVCKASASLAIQEIAKINQSNYGLTQILGDLELVSVNGPVENWQAGAYSVQANTGSDDYKTCAIMSVTFSPQP